MKQKQILEDLLISIAVHTLDPGMTRYTYKWFKTILWALNYNKKTDFNRPKEIIRFNSHKISDDRRIIELSYPSRYILLSYETARKRKLIFGSNDKTISGFEIESVSLAPEYVEVLFDKPLTEEIIIQFGPISLLMGSSFNCSEFFVANVTLAVHFFQLKKGVRGARLVLGRVVAKA